MYMHPASGRGIPRTALPQCRGGSPRLSENNQRLECTLQGFQWMFCLPLFNCLKIDTILIKRFPYATLEIISP